MFSHETSYRLNAYILTLNSLVKTTSNDLTEEVILRTLLVKLKRRHHHQ